MHVPRRTPGLDTPGSAGQRILDPIAALRPGHDRYQGYQQIRAVEHDLARAYATYTADLDMQTSWTRAVAAGNQAYLACHTEQITAWNDQSHLGPRGQSNSHWPDADEPEPARANSNM